MIITLNSYHTAPTGSYTRPAGIRNNGIVNKNPQGIGVPADRVSISKTQLHRDTGRTADMEPAGKPFSFLDLIDIVNPLQHIPIVGTIYRAVTNDEIKSPARILGGGIFGGLIGGISGIVNAVLAKTTGRDMGGHIMALFQHHR